MSKVIFVDSRIVTTEMFTDSVEPIIVHYAVSLKECEQREYGRVFKFFDTLSCVGAPACMSLLFSFDGYDFDPRPLALLPEVVRFVKTITDTYPHIWYYLLPAVNPHMFESVISSTIIHSPFSKTGQMQVQLDVPKAEEKLQEMKLAIEAHAVSVGDVNGGKIVLLAWRSALNML